MELSDVPTRVQSVDYPSWDESKEYATYSVTRLYHFEIKKAQVPPRHLRQENNAALDPNNK